jgi:CHRD domain
VIRRLVRKAFTVTKFLVILLSIVAIFAVTGTAAAKPQARIFIAHMSGDDEVPQRDTDGRGVALFIADKDGGEIDYKIVVAQIENVVAAHIHCGVEGMNGPVGVTLFTAAPAGGVENGIIASGTITDPDAINGCDWETLEDVIAAMGTGNTYTNVHTNDGVAPINTGPGDFPGGEIRGQNRALP